MAHPKIFQGLSDITVLHCALQRHAGLATFYGPALVTSLAEFPRVFELTDRKHARRVVRRPVRSSSSQPTEWTDEFLDFGTKADLARPRAMQRGEGWVWLHPGVADGPILGGCIETLCWHVKGIAGVARPRWAACCCSSRRRTHPHRPPLPSYLTDLRRLGVMDQICGLVFSRPINYRADDIPILWNVVREATADAGIPVLANVDCGHSDPMITVPLGIDVRLDSMQRDVRNHGRAHGRSGT